eukprot:TRINITY_DN57923_c0_g1_i3.p1 TRINITY_DN57923_c0_g1~~TRINITY_DN57923_c0_g1_i3.p1  ORF type:complete len:207 (+),score=33.85 TRINITY_DN57923_c0_g1_i3:177-797(+)
MCIRDRPTGDLDTATTIEIMDLLTKLCHLIGTTLIMVTHNPDIECYADRILFVSDGTFKRQAINLRPRQLDYESYQQYLVEKDKQLTTRVTLNGAVATGIPPASSPSSPLVPTTTNTKNGAIVAPEKGKGQQHQKQHVDLSLIHISEPTRLLSISYAVFCLKKKKIITCFVICNNADTNTHLRANETVLDNVCRLMPENKKHDIFI